MGFHGLHMRSSCWWWCTRRSLCGASSASRSSNPTIVGDRSVQPRLYSGSDTRAVFRVPLVVRPVCRHLSKPYRRRVRSYQMCIPLSHFSPGRQPVARKGPCFSGIEIVHENVHFLPSTENLRHLYTDWCQRDYILSWSEFFIFRIQSHIDHCDFYISFNQARVRDVGRHSWQSNGRFLHSPCLMHYIKIRLW